MPIPRPTTQSPSAPQRQALLGGCAAALRRTHVILRSLVAVHVGAPRRHSARRRVRVRQHPIAASLFRPVAVAALPRISSARRPRREATAAKAQWWCGWPQLRTEREAEPAHHRRVSTARTPPLRSRTNAHTRAHRVTHACVLLVAAATHSPHCPDSRQPPARGTLGVLRVLAALSG
jgi:hypothetical protein